MSYPEPMTVTDTVEQPAACTATQEPRGLRLRRPRFGIGWRLGLGLGLVSAVLIAGEVLATRITH
ncbi:MAG: hypothetical protein JO173_02685, partial [Gammaproteobacteria bacterium]|nr:hypothetical protein [Gammaproteobacteria bacterium]